MELLFEIFFEVYAELMLLIVPEKERSKRSAALLRALAVLVLLGAFALVIWGGVLISDYNNLFGLIPICVAAIISLCQIILGIILFNKNH